MEARWRGVNAMRRMLQYGAHSNLNFEIELPLSVFNCVGLWIHPAKSLIVQIDRIDHADDGRVDGRVGAADRGHGGKTFSGKQHAVADARVHSVERDDGIATICPVKLKRLNDENFAPFMGRDLLRRDNVSDYATDEHAK
jgi:hypothetical protein